jgi:hypothetical protein
LFFSLALILAFSPWEKEQLSDGVWFSGEHQENAAPDSSRE